MPSDDHLYGHYIYSDIYPFKFVHLFLFCFFRFPSEIITHLSKEHLLKF